MPSKKQRAKKSRAKKHKAKMSLPGIDVGPEHGVIPPVGTLDDGVQPNSKSYEKMQLQAMKNLAESNPDLAKQLPHMLQMIVVNNLFMRSFPDLDVFCQPLTVDWIKSNPRIVGMHFPEKKFMLQFNGQQASIWTITKEGGLEIYQYLVFPHLPTLLLGGCPIIPLSPLSIEKVGKFILEPTGE